MFWFKLRSCVILRQSDRHLGSHDPLDGISGQGVEEEDQEDDEGEPAQDLDDGPLVVVPDDVADRLDRVQEPHERRIRTTRMIIGG